MESYSLPLELLFAIVTHIDPSEPEGRQCLSACTGTNHALLGFCQRLLFRDVELSYQFPLNADRRIVFCDDQGTTGQKFLHLLDASPHIGSYIENLTITVEVPTGRRKPFELATSTHKSSSSDSFSLYKIVPRLTNLKGFITSHTQRAYWSVLDDRTKSFFVGLFPLLRKLDLFLLVFLPVSVFSGCASLEELHVWGAETDLNYLPAKADKVKIRALEVGYGPDPSRKPIAPLFSPPHSSLDISHLRNLKLTDALLPVSDVDDILKLCSNNLQELDLFLALHAKNVRPLSFEKTPNLGLLHNLCFLVLRSTIESHPLFTLEEYNDLLYVASTLKTLPFDNLHRKQLQLTLQVEFIDLHNFENIVTSLSGWSDLTALLEENGIYFESTKIMFRRAEYNEKLVLIPILLTAMEDIMDRDEGLKRLREKGMLSYEYF